MTALALAVALAVGPAQFLQAHQTENGGFAEPGGRPTAGLTAWASLALSAGGSTDERAIQYLKANERELVAATDLELALAAEAAAGPPSESLLARVRALARPSGAIGPTLNSTYWGVIALRQADAPVPRATRDYILRRQTRSGGWAWTAGSAPDSNDTAAALQALRALGVRGRPIHRGLVYLRRLQNRDGGFELTEGRGSDAQSTAWAIQAFLAAGQRPGAAAFAYLRRLRREDGSYRYSAAYAVTPVWVTAQVLPALAGRPFPLR
jgi:hypothetical protein